MQNSRCFTVNLWIGTYNLFDSLVNISSLGLQWCRPLSSLQRCEVQTAPLADLVYVQQQVADAELEQTIQGMNGQRGRHHCSPKELMSILFSILSTVSMSPVCWSTATTTVCISAAPLDLYGHIASLGRHPPSCWPMRRHYSRPTCLVSRLQQRRSWRLDSTTAIIFRTRRLHAWLVPIISD